MTLNYFFNSKWFESPPPPKGLKKKRRKPFFGGFTNYNSLYLSAHQTHKQIGPRPVGWDIIGPNTKQRNIQTKQELPLRNCSLQATTAQCPPQTFILSEFLNSKKLAQAMVCYNENYCTSYFSNLKIIIYFLLIFME
jgi:hypothetical protein